MKKLEENLEEKEVETKIKESFKEKIKRKIKKRLKKEWKHLKIAATGLVLLEGIVGGYTLSQSIDGDNKFVEYNETALRTIRNSIACTYHELPQHIKYKLDINQVTGAQMQEALMNPKSVARINELMNQDDLRPYTEIHGLITLDYENGNALFRFYEMPTANGELANKIVANRQNEKELEQIIQKNIGVFITVTKLEESSINKSIQEGRIQVLASQYLVQSDSIASNDWQLLSKFYYDNWGEIKGEIIGQFHTHNIESPPSPADLKSSKISRTITLVRTWDKYQLYDLIKEEEKLYEVKR